MKGLAKKKMAKLERRWGDIPKENKSVRIVLNSAPEGTFLVKIEVSLRGERIYTEETGYELETALVGAVKEIDRLYLKSKDKSREGDWEERRESKVLSEKDLEKMAAAEEELENEGD
jgi:ribosome-associated translation inhibitor RaiA